MKIYSIFDSKAEAYLTPWFSPTNGIAIRTITEAVNDPTHGFGKHSQDYTLFELGHFDPETGAITLNATRVNLGVLIEFKELKTNQALGLVEAG